MSCELVWKEDRKSGIHIVLWVYSVPSKLYIIGFQPHKCHATAHGHVIVHAAVAIMTLIRVCPVIIVHAQYAGCKGELYTEVLNSLHNCVPVLISTDKSNIPILFLFVICVLGLVVILFLSFL